MIINFDRNKFFPLKNKIKCNDLLDILKNKCLNSKINSNFVILDISSLNIIRDYSIIFLNDNTKVDLNSKERLIITNNNSIYDNYENIILVKNLDDAFNIICNFMFFHEDGVNSKDDFDLIAGSYISKNCYIDPKATIGKNCFIGRGVEIGPESIIKNNVVIKNSIIGSNVIISDNSTIGSTGFGFSLFNLGVTNLYPHVGIVLIEDNVRIGSNCTIDRGKIDYTLIGKNSMLDNQIHIAHNVIIKSNACIAAQCGISGSVTIGHNIIVGGQSGFAGHIKIGNNVIVAAKSGVTKNISDKASIAGYPAINLSKWKKMIIKQREK